MLHKISSEDIEFLAEFESCQLGLATFHHRQHIQLAYILLVKYELKSAHRQLKLGLLKFLSFNNVDPKKYHETMTYAWLLAVKHFMFLSAPSANFAEFIEANLILLNQDIMLGHYSRELLSSSDARRTFIEPDLDFIPRH